MRKHSLSKALLVFVTVGWLTGCISTTENCAKPRNVQGSWAYSAIQENPVHSTLTGTLVIAAQSCADFEGTLDVTEITTGGERRRIAGPVTGVLLDSLSARFSATVDGADREHLARFSRDSVRGTWVQVQSSATAAGSFFGRQGAK
jgi:hypothetical protein